MNGRDRHFARVALSLLGAIVCVLSNCLYAPQAPAQIDWQENNEWRTKGEKAMRDALPTSATCARSEEASDCDYEAVRNGIRYELNTHLRAHTGNVAGSFISWRLVRSCDSRACGDYDNRDSPANLRLFQGQDVTSLVDAEIAIIAKLFEVSNDELARCFASLKANGSNIILFREGRIAFRCDRDVANSRIEICGSVDRNTKF